MTNAPAMPGAVAQCLALLALQMWACGGSAPAASCAADGDGGGTEDQFLLQVGQRSSMSQSPLRQKTSEEDEPFLPTFLEAELSALLPHGQGKDGSKVKRGGKDAGKGKRGGGTSPEGDGAFPSPDPAAAYCSQCPTLANSGLTELQQEQIMNAVRTSGGEFINVDGVNIAQGIEDALPYLAANFSLDTVVNGVYNPVDYALEYLTIGNYEVNGLFGFRSLSYETVLVCPGAMSPRTYSGASALYTLCTASAADNYLKIPLFFGKSFDIELPDQKIYGSLDIVEEGGALKALYLRPFEPLGAFLNAAELGTVFGLTPPPRKHCAEMQSLCTGGPCLEASCANTTKFPYRNMKTCQKTLEALPFRCQDSSNALYHGNAQVCRQIHTWLMKEVPSVHCWHGSLESMGKCRNNKCPGGRYCKDNFCFVRGNCVEDPTTFEMSCRWEYSPFKVLPAMKEEIGNMLSDLLVVAAAVLR
mmetsp:Transcript_35823/g.108262  ORF Transcript_35823/g.108262 Transcript_35823/m.108262 type:complete len:473 (-) Transcript_35823:4-1422(-)